MSKVKTIPICAIDVCIGMVIRESVVFSKKGERDETPVSRTVVDFHVTRTTLTLIYDDGTLGLHRHSDKLQLVVDGWWKSVWHHIQDLISQRP